MEIKSFDTILTEICDYFDSLISPKTISRSNTNIIYLMFKAIAKGYEIINNVCVAVNNKFDPANCSSEDLESVSAIVGTSRLEGSASGLYIIVTNNGTSDVTLFSGTYNYAFDDNTTFYFDVLIDTVIASGEKATFIAMSQNVGSYAVTAQNSIIVTSVKSISEDLAFSCQDNSTLLGTTAESDLEFRQRILNGVDNQDSIVELENTLKNLPYLFDCKCKYNQKTDSIVYDGLTIPPFNLAIFYSGMPRNEIAEKVASKIICPTVATENSTKLSYENTVFAEDSYTINIIPFKKTSFDVTVIMHVDTRYAEINKVEAQIRTALNTALTSNVHKDYVKESDIYTIISDLNIAGITLLGANLSIDGEDKEYISIPVSRIPQLNTVNFTLE